MKLQAVSIYICMTLVVPAIVLAHPSIMVIDGRELALTTDCLDYDGHNAMPDGSPILIKWDQFEDGPDPSDPLVPVGTGSGEWNYNQLLINGTAALGLPGTFFSERALTWEGNSQNSPYPAIYFEIVQPNGIDYCWRSNLTYTIPGGYRYINSLSWSCQPCLQAHNIDLVETSDRIGCNASCLGDTLYLTFDQANFVTGQIFLQLDPALDVDWVPGNNYQSVFPASNASTHLVFAAARRSAGNQLEIAVQWQPPFSDGDNSKYVACIPFKNVAGVDDATLCITGVSSSFYDVSQTPVTSYTFGSACVTVDCEAPTASFTPNGAGCAAIKDAADLEYAYSISIAAGGIPNSQLALAFVEVNSNPTQRISLFNSLQPSDYNNATWPSAAEATTLYGWMVEGCNTLTLYYEDAECNSATTTLSNIGRDHTPPSLSVNHTPPINYCYNNNVNSDHFGGAFLEHYLDIGSDVGSIACAASSGNLIISHSGLPDWDFPLNVGFYPATNAEATALWNWMMSDPTMASSDGGTFTFDVRAADCAGNTTFPQSFSICIDTQAPVNAVTVFDARPAHLGVWLKWQWAAGSQAQEMRVFRSPLTSQYPSYPNDLWNNPANYDVTSVPPAGWTPVAQQSGVTGTITSATESSNNNRGDFYQHLEAGETYWLDADVNWLEGNGNASTYRDIYRYVTFVKDAGGNWSTGSTVSFGQNADRSTNYWLGDFATADAGGTPASQGRVNSEDLAVLATYFFTSPGSHYTDIGPTVVENGSISRGIPIPDGMIDFLDLVPFSFTYGVVAPVGLPGEFEIQLPPRSKRFENMDEMPVLSLVPIGDANTNVEFSVAVQLTGNGDDVVKVLEAEIGYDPQMLDFVSATTATVEHNGGGELFSKAAPVEGETGVVGVAVGACGERAMLNGNQSVATISFRRKHEHFSGTALNLVSVKMADGSGGIYSSAGNGLTFGANDVIPTSYALYQNFPNPFNPNTEVRFDLPEQANIRLVIYNTLGQEVRTLIAESMLAGRHNIAWDGRDNHGQMCGTGVYIYRIASRSFAEAKKMLLMR